MQEQASDYRLRATTLRQEALSVLDERRVQLEALARGYDRLAANLEHGANGGTEH